MTRLSTKESIYMRLDLWKNLTDNSSEDLLSALYALGDGDTLTRWGLKDEDLHVVDEVAKEIKQALAEVQATELEALDSWIETVHQNILAYGSEQEKADWQWAQDHVDDADEATRTKAMNLYDALVGKFEEE